jgi:hypothetical protein
MTVVYHGRHRQTDVPRGTIDLAMAADVDS